MPFVNKDHLTLFKKKKRGRAKKSNVTKIETCDFVNVNESENESEESSQCNYLMNKTKKVPNVKYNGKVQMEDIDEKDIKICDNCGLKFVLIRKVIQVNQKWKSIFIPYHIEIRNGKCPKKINKKRYWKYDKSVEDYLE